MAKLEQRAQPGASPLSTTTIIAIVTGTGIVLLGLFVALVVLLIRAVRNHKKLLADLEERSVSLAHIQGEARNSVTRPRAVLRRNTVLPFNAKTGWGTLPSTETFGSSEALPALEHYAPTNPNEDPKKTSGLGWPFSGRNSSSSTILLKNVKGSRLSTVMEDPKSLGSTQVGLPYRPITRNPTQDAQLAEEHSRANGGPFFRSHANRRLQRARSVAAIPSPQTVRPRIRARSTSLCSQIPGAATDVLLPPLPFELARLKNEANRSGQLRQAASRLSVSNCEPADMSRQPIRPGINPIIPQATKNRAQRVNKPERRSPEGPRQMRDTFDLRSYEGQQRLNMGNMARASMALPDFRDFKLDNSTASKPHSNSQILDPVTRTQSMTFTRGPSPGGSPRTVRSVNTPKRRSKTYVSSSGSPERQLSSDAPPRSYTGAVRSPKRQHSQTSSRSSGGNPFQWDVTPLSATGKPSALKGSPSARQTHRRKNSVRISLVPTIHGHTAPGPPMPTSSPSRTNANREDSTGGASANNVQNGVGFGFPSTRSLPTPPSSSTFEPELNFPATTLRASLTSTSPTLPLVGYDQSYVVFPTDHISSERPEYLQRQKSSDSILSLSRFPATPSVIETSEFDLSQAQPGNSHPCDLNGYFPIPDTPMLSQYPFGSHTSDRDRSPSPTDMISIDEYDPERPSMVFQTPAANTSSRAFQSAFPTIPEESSVASSKATTQETSRYNDSPPVSPMTMSPPKFSLGNRPAYNLPVQATAIPEETVDTINPAMLTKDAFTMLNHSMDNLSRGFTKTPNSSRSSLTIIIPESPSSQNVFEPLLPTAFAPDQPFPDSYESPVLGRLNSDSRTSSNYSSRATSPTNSPNLSFVQTFENTAPCSPRPHNAQLPSQRLSINFAEVPKLTPTSRGPRDSPSRPLRSSIAALRRMNSDAADAKKDKAGRGERRYLRIGRETSVQLPNDESWLDDIDDDTNVELDEEEGRRLVGNVLDEEYDEGQTVLDLNEGDTSMTITQTETTITQTSIPQDEDTQAGAQESHSDIWEDGEKFWTSNYPVPRVGSPNKPPNRYQPLASSPLAGDPISTTPDRKRDFEVAKDASPTTLSPTENANRSAEMKKRRETRIDSRGPSMSNQSNRKRSVLGNGTPNVRIQVTSPDGQIIGSTPGSLYDSQGFLNFEYSPEQGQQTGY